MTITSAEENLLLKMISAAQPSLRDLVLAIELGSIKDDTYAIKSRVKTLESAREKILRKRDGGEKDFGPGSLTDIIGLRFITLYREDILKIVARICDMISGEPGTQSSPFLPKSLDIARAYLSSGGDLTSMKDGTLMIINRHFPKLRVEFPERAAYSGIHLIGRLKASKGIDCPAPYATGVPIEIQIRSVFEDTWGEIDHPSRYKNKHLAAISAAGGPAPIVEHHIKLLKHFMDAAAGYADLIKRMVADLDAQSLGSGAVTKSLNSFENMRTALKHFEVPAGGASQFLNLLTRRDQLYERKPRTPLEKQAFQAEFEECAEGFRRLEEDESRPGALLNQDTRSSRAFDYFLKVERGLSYLYAESTSNLNAAIQLYELVVAKAPNSVSTHFRLGQAYSKHRKIDESISHFEAALDIVDKLPQMSIDDRMLFLPDQERTGLKWKAQKLLGVQYHQKSQIYVAQRLRTEQLDYLRKSLKITKMALQICDENAKLSIYNNLLYYVARYIQEAEAGDLPCGTERAELEGYLNIVRQLLTSGHEVAEPPNWAAWYDTVAFVCEFLGKQEEARSAAKMVLKLLLAPEGQETIMYSQEDKDTMLQRAWHIMDDESQPQAAE